MSKARLVITAVLVEGRSQHEVARAYGVSVSIASISRCLRRAGLLVPRPKKRPRSSHIRFRADLPKTEPGHLGLIALRERARLFDGWCRFVNGTSGGAVVEIWVPSQSIGDVASVAPRADLATQGG